MSAHDTTGTTSTPASASFTTVQGIPCLGVLPALRKDPLGFFTRSLQQHGDRVTFHVLGQQVFLLANPNDIEEVLIKDRENYGRSQEVLNLRPIFGNGLLTSEGDLWKKQRRLIQPKFSHTSMQQYANVMLECIQEQIAAWQPGEQRSMKPEMMMFTREVVCRTLFGRTPSQDAQKIAHAVTTVFGELKTEILYLPIWRMLPLPRSLRWNRAAHALNHAIHHMIAERRSDSVQREDLLGLLMGTRDDDGSSMDDQQIHDEVLTMFLAGHETSAVLLTWSLALLAQHPAIQEKAAEEIKTVTGGNALTVAMLPQLALLHAIVQETLRLYPAVWSLGRKVLHDTTLGSTAIPKDSHIWMCTYAVHRNTTWYPNAESFQPERWLHTPTPKRTTFLPFGAGPRMCIGQHFATTEAVLALAAILFRFQLIATHPDLPKKEPWITLRPQGLVPLQLVERKTSKTTLQ